MDPLAHLEKIEREVTENRTAQHQAQSNLAEIKIKIEAQYEIVQKLEAELKVINLKVMPENISKLREQLIPVSKITFSNEILQKVFIDSAITGFKASVESENVSLRFKFNTEDNTLGELLNQQEEERQKLAGLQKQETRLLKQLSTALDAAKSSLERLKEKYAPETFEAEETTAGATASA